MKLALLLLASCLLAGGALLWWSRDVPRQGPPHPDLYGIPPPLPSRLQWRSWTARLWQGWPWARPPGPPPLPPFPPLPPLRNQGLVGVTISDPQTGVYLGSPSIARLGDGTLLVSHDYFPEWGRTKRTSIYTSTDGGHAWHRRATLPRQFWSTLFVHQGAVYLLGVDDAEGPNAISIARSWDGGASWNRTALLPAPPGCQWATGSVPVLLHLGILYRGTELWCGPSLRWPQSYQAVVIYAPAAADLLEPAFWRVSQLAPFDSSAMLPAWMPGPVNSGGFLEGNAVALPYGRVALLLRCRVYDEQGRTYTLQHACLFHLEPPPAGGQATEGNHAAAQHQVAERQLAELPQQQARLQPQPQPPQPGSSPAAASAAAAWAAVGAPSDPLRLAWQGFVDMPGGGNKFTARLDPSTGLYLALTNPSIDRYGANADARGILALAFSRDLLSWRVAATLLRPNDGLPWEESLWRTAYQYADWIVEGDDLLVAIRTAYGGAHSFHDSNWVTFKRVQHYRQYLPAVG